MTKAFKRLTILVLVSLTTTVYTHIYVTSSSSSSSPSSVWTPLSRNHIATHSSALLSARYTSQQNYSNTLLLTVPFYVYEELAWLDATFGNQSVAELAHTPHRNKHADDYFFMKASLEHPLRTTDPHKAQLFVIPLLLNFYADRHYYSGTDFKLCHHHPNPDHPTRRYCDKEWLRQAQEVLQQSEWLQQFPEKHIVVQSHYLADLNLKVPKPLKAMLYQVNVLAFEDKVPNHPDRLCFPTLYVGTPCRATNATNDEDDGEDHKTQDVAMIAGVNSNKMHYFQDRLDVCDWTRSRTATDNDNSNDNTNASASANSTTTPTIRMSHCGRGQQCPALAQAKFGFHTRGDTFGSNRLFDTLLSGTIPIFTRPEQYDILPTWIDWKNQLSYMLPIRFKNQTTTATTTTEEEEEEPQQQKEAFLTGLMAIMNDDEGYQRRRQAVLTHLPLFDWTTLYPFDTYMYMLQAELYPETRHRQHPTVPATTGSGGDDSQNWTSSRTEFFFSSHWPALKLPSASVLSF